MKLYIKQVKVIRKDLIFNVDKPMSDWITEEEAIPLFDEYTVTFKRAPDQAILMIERYIPIKKEWNDLTNDWIKNIKEY